ncbi:hypothetical protein NEHOM01_1958 [Nematocida homosporus]|uniref:uncharacterized protein n=1 Tax=Nematocida homosporus TaxID=1912981 RepID=UPI00221F9C89|nr:uncharacterized protein NEHOM01_1958 [Nematocida homosporus]KAI5187132.1 hypothetical protein NEHOM01_1958 [Nematocida homosporus]
MVLTEKRDIKEPSIFKEIIDNKKEFVKKLDHHSIDWRYQIFSNNEEGFPREEESIEPYIITTKCIRELMQAYELLSSIEAKETQTYAFLLNGRGAGHKNTNLNDIITILTTMAKTRKLVCITGESSWRPCSKESDISDTDCVAFILNALAPFAVAKIKLKDLVLEGLSDVMTKNRFKSPSISKKNVPPNPYRHIEELYLENVYDIGDLLVHVNHRYSDHTYQYPCYQKANEQAVNDIFNSLYTRIVDAKPESANLIQSTNPHHTTAPLRMDDMFLLSQFNSEKLNNNANYDKNEPIPISEMERIAYKYSLIKSRTELEWRSFLELCTNLSTLYIHNSTLQDMTINSNLQLKQPDSTDKPGIASWYLPNLRYLILSCKTICYADLLILIHASNLLVFSLAYTPCSDYSLGPYQTSLLLNLIPLVQTRIFKERLAAVPVAGIVFQVSPAEADALFEREGVTCRVAMIEAYIWAQLAPLFYQGRTMVVVDLDGLAYLLDNKFLNPDTLQRVYLVGQDLTLQILHIAEHGQLFRANIYSGQALMVPLYKMCSWLTQGKHLRHLVAVIEASHISLTKAIVRINNLTCTDKQNQDRPDEFYEHLKYRTQLKQGCVPVIGILPPKYFSHYSVGGHMFGFFAMLFQSLEVFNYFYAHEVPIVGVGLAPCTGNCYKVGSFLSNTVGALTFASYPPPLVNDPKIEEPYISANVTPIFQEIQNRRDIGTVEVLKGQKDHFSYLLSAFKKVQRCCHDKTGDQSSWTAYAYEGSLTSIQNAYGETITRDNKNRVSQLLTKLNLEEFFGLLPNFEEHTKAKQIAKKVPTPIPILTCYKTQCFLTPSTLIPSLKKSDIVFHMSSPCSTSPSFITAPTTSTIKDKTSKGPSKPDGAYVRTSAIRQDWSDFKAALAACGGTLNNSTILAPSTSDLQRNSSTPAEAIADYFESLSRAPRPLNSNKPDNYALKECYQTQLSIIFKGKYRPSLSMYTMALPAYIPTNADISTAIFHQFPLTYCVAGVDKAESERKALVKCMRDLSHFQKKNYYLYQHDTTIDMKTHEGRSGFDRYHASAFNYMWDCIKALHSIRECVDPKTGKLCTTLAGSIRPALAIEAIKEVTEGPFDRLRSRIVCNDIYNTYNSIASPDILPISIVCDALTNATNPGQTPQDKPATTKQGQPNTKTIQTHMGNFSIYYHHEKGLNTDQTLPVLHSSHADPSN